MSERTGTCTSCGQRFGGIPDSVTALKVKCRECNGEVVIPPLPEPEPAPVVEAKTPPKAKRPDKAKPVDRVVAGATPAAPKPIVPPKKAFVPPKKAFVPP
ncbi:MAG: hypothetical protein HOC43_10380, partial [Planctomycetes bacterium]|nr:hypothetical protein [Planctomycetota bacterium]